MKKNILFLLAIIATLAAHAQNKVPDMSRFSKAPMGPVKTGRSVAKAAHSRNANGVPDMSRFSKAPLNNAGGGTARSAMRKTNTAGRVQQSSSLPSNKPVQKVPVTAPAKQPALEQETQAPAEKH